MRRILIDECINPRLQARLQTVLSAFSITTVRELGWTGRKDRDIAAAMQGTFDVFITIDKGFEFEHNLKELAFGIVIIETRNNQMPSYERVLEVLARQITDVTAGQVMHVRDPQC